MGKDGDNICKGEERAGTVREKRCEHVRVLKHETQEEESLSPPLTLTALKAEDNTNNPLRLRIEEKHRWISGA